MLTYQTKNCNMSYFNSLCLLTKINITLCISYNYTFNYSTIFNKPPENNTISEHGDKDTLNKKFQR